MLDLKTYRAAHSLSGKEVAQTLRPYYPKVNKIAICMAESGEYAIGLLPEAEQILTGENKPRRADRHRIKSRVSCRVTSEVLEQFNSAMQREGYSTCQSYMEHIIREHLKRLEAANG